MAPENLEIYNSSNILIQQKDIVHILSKAFVHIDKIHKLNLFQQAMTHKSYCTSEYPIVSDTPINCLKLQENSYERLEFLGDRVIKLIVSTYLFHRYYYQDEGFMTRLQTKLEDKTTLSNMSKYLGLDKFFLLSKSMENINSRSYSKFHEDMFESFIGALYLSNGIDICTEFLINLLETIIDYSDKLYCDSNYKDKLLRHYHQNKWGNPLYITMSFEGPPHKRKYIIGVKREQDAEYDGYGNGISKKEAEQNAAKMALIKLGLLKEDQYKSSDIYYPENTGTLESNDYL
jgi:ribonuclease-3